MLTVILTGGQSRRMGRDKATLPYRDGTLLQTLIDRYAALGPVGISSDRVGRFRFHGAVELADPYPGEGPMNGVLAGFRETGEAELLLTAVDLPYGDPALAVRLSQLRGDADVCAVAFGPKGLEPLFAVYGRTCAPAAEEFLRSGRRALTALFERVRVRLVDPGELRGFDLERIFTNVNTPEDYRRLIEE